MYWGCFELYWSKACKQTQHLGWPRLLLILTIVKLHYYSSENMYSAKLKVPSRALTPHNTSSTCKSCAQVTGSTDTTNCLTPLYTCMVNKPDHPIWYNCGWVKLKHNLGLTQTRNPEIKSLATFLFYTWSNLLHQFLKFKGAILNI